MELKRYLDPKADLTFKKVFGEHADLLISFLNALLPLKDDEQIQHIDYLSPELVPNTPLKKDSIVDVRCRDQKGRQFIVEMQMLWTNAFMQRVLFNAAKAYVSQLDRRQKYELLQPVYSLALLNQNYMKNVSDYYHVYNIVCDKYSDSVIEGLHFVFVELPKFTPQTITEKKMTALWLRFLTEIDENTREVSDDLLANPEVKKALDTVEESGYSDAQLLGYDRFWDSVRTEKTFYSDARRIGREEGRQEGHAEGIKEGREEGREEGRQEGHAEGRAEGIKEGREEGHKEGRKQEKLAIAIRMKEEGFSEDAISKITGLSKDEVKGL